MFTGFAVLVTFTWPIGKPNSQFAAISHADRLQASRQPSTPSCTVRPISSTLSRPHPCVSLALLVHFVVSGNRTTSCQPESYSLPGWAFGHFFNEWIYRRHSAKWRSELRLHGVWIPIGSMACGLLTYGLTMNFGKHWIGLAFGWIMVDIGMVGTIV